MSEQRIIQCTVLDGHVVDDGRSMHEPGEEIGLSADEADRLTAAGIVGIIKGVSSGPDPEVAAALKVVADGITTRAGLPKAEAIAEILGKPVTAAERDIIWHRAEGGA